MFKQVPMKIVVPIIVITWVLALISALAITTSGVMSIGATGATGAKGDTGPAGAAGSQGSKGDAGAAGATGATGPAGSGSAGPAGPQGTAGTAGTNGVNGVNGATWWNGTAAPPAPSLGSNGDFYLNTANGNVYNKVAGSWTNVANIKGATGAQGPPGATTIKYNDIGSVGGAPTTMKALGNVTLTAPATGSVFVTAKAWVCIFGPATAYHLYLGTSSGSSDLDEIGVGYWSGGPADSGWWCATVQGVYNVTAGNSYTFFLSGYKEGTATINLVEIKLTAQFMAT